MSGDPIKVVHNLRDKKRQKVLKRAISTDGLKRDSHYTKEKDRLAN